MSGSSSGISTSAFSSCRRESFAGAWFAQSYGSKAPLLIVIVLKTLVDLGSRSGGSSFPMTVSTNGTTVSIKPNDPTS